jgi:hypothetical protein
MTHDDTRLGELLRALPPAPRVWVDAAKRMPYLHAELDAILAAAATDGAFREALERALRARGFEADADVVAHVRRRLRPDTGG